MVKILFQEIYYLLLKFWVNNHAHVIKPNSSTDIDYLTQYLETLSYVQYNTGTAQPKLNQAICKTIPIALPCFEEQKKIGKFLSIIDDKIDCMVRQLQQALHFKKGLMQQLFN